MASSSSLLHISTTIRFSSASHNRHLNNNNRLSLISLQQSLSSSRSVLTFARRRNKPNSSIPSSKKKKKRSLLHNDAGKEEDLDEDAFEALFQQLEEDLKNDDLSFDDDDEITEEDLLNLERELEEALADDELVGLFDSIDEEREKELKDDKVRLSDSPAEGAIEVEAKVKDQEEEDDEEEEVEEEKEEEEEEEEGIVELKRWQLRRLAYALKDGRRKTSIKNLAADLCLDRAVVLELLRDPPPDLLMLSATLPDKPMPTISEPETNSVEDVPLESGADATNMEATVKVPVHVMQHNWSAQKRLKKVHIETLERVYRRSKRPTNAMISNIVHVTNIPRKRVVKWFEDKRSEDGVPDHRLPYQRSAPETVFTS